MSPGACDKYCLVRASGEEFAVPASQVREIVANVAVITVPGCQTTLAGICHVRNEFLPVLRCAAEWTQDTDLVGDQPLLIVHGAHGPWALAVDVAIGLASLEPALCLDGALADVWSDAVVGTASYQDRVVRVLDPAALYRSAERQLREHFEHWPLPAPAEDGGVSWEKDA
jgi:purine-binding chemotaxis protein CheW